MVTGNVHPEIDRFASLDSTIHRWDPRWKIVGFSFLVLAFAVGGGDAGRSADPAHHLPLALAALAIAIVLIGLSRIPFAIVLRSLRPALVFFAPLFLILPFTQDDGVAIAGPLEFSTAGLLTATLVSLRATSILLLVFPMFGTSHFDDTARALRGLLLPGTLVQLIVFSYRYLFVLSDEMRRMQIAWRARGFTRRPGLHSLRTIGNGVAMLLVGSMERSQRIYQAMVSRGYDGTFRTQEMPATRPVDVAKTAAMAGVAIVFVLWRVW